MECVFKKDINTAKQTLNVPQTPDIFCAGNCSANPRGEILLSDSIRQIFGPDREDIQVFPVVTKGTWIL